MIIVHDVGVRKQENSLGSVAPEALVCHHAVANITSSCLVPLVPDGARGILPWNNLCESTSLTAMRVG